MITIFHVSGVINKWPLITGVIRVNQELDREVQSVHQLTVMVRDQGKQSHRNYTYVTIHVTDHNDFAPEFLEAVIEGRVFETAALGTSVVEVMAIDKDKGNNAELSFAITAGRGDNKGVQND